VRNGQQPLPPLLPPGEAGFLLITHKLPTTLDNVYGRQNVKDAIEPQVSVLCVSDFAGRLGFTE
jgi:hypothetical protein